jgi:hypothetical protein
LIERGFTYDGAVAGCTCDRERNRHSTIVEKESHLRLYLKPAFGNLRLDAIGKEQVDRFYADMTKKGLSEKSRKNIGGTLRTILGTALEWEVIDKLPKFPKIKVPAPEWDYYNAEESALLLSKARTPEEKALLMFPLRTGARAGEQYAHLAPGAGADLIRALDRSPNGRGNGQKTAAASSEFLKCFR